MECQFSRDEYINHFFKPLDLFISGLLCFWGPNLQPDFKRVDPAKTKRCFWMKSPLFYSFVLFIKCRIFDDKGKNLILKKALQDFFDILEISTSAGLSIRSRVNRCKRPMSDLKNEKEIPERQSLSWKTPFFLPVFIIVLPFCSRIQ